MATKKKQTKKQNTNKAVVKKQVNTVSSTEAFGGNLGLFFKQNNLGFISRVALVVLVGLILFFLATRYRGLVLAGIVNKKPIFRTELNQMLTKRYGKVVLDELINNELVKQEARKMGISVSDEEMNQELKKLEERIGGETALNEALVQYGLSRAELEEQIRTSLLQKKIAEQVADIEVSEEEIVEYFTSNKTYYEGKKLEDVREEIALTIREQKTQEEFGKWFAEVKSQAQIETYID